MEMSQLWIPYFLSNEDVRDQREMVAEWDGLLAEYTISHKKFILLATNFYKEIYSGLGDKIASNKKYIRIRRISIKVLLNKG